MKSLHLEMQIEDNIRARMSPAEARYCSAPGGQTRAGLWRNIGFAVLALLMAAIGVYGLIQYSVTTRTHDGIRTAMGAQAGEVFRMIIGEGLKLSLALGLIGGLWLSRASASLLFGVTAIDPSTFVAVSLLLTAVATAACFFPARRAMKGEPTVALRQE